MTDLPAFKQAALDEFERRMQARLYTIEELAAAAEFTGPAITIDDDHQRALQQLLDLENTLEDMVVDRTEYGEVTLRHAFAGTLQQLRRAIREHQADVHYDLAGREERAAEAARSAAERLRRL